MEGSRVRKGSQCRCLYILCLMLDYGVLLKDCRGGRWTDGLVFPSFVVGVFIFSGLFLRHVGVCCSC